MFKINNVFHMTVEKTEVGVLINHNTIVEQELASIKKYFEILHYNIK